MIHDRQNGNRLADNRGLVGDDNRACIGDLNNRAVGVSLDNAIDDGGRLGRG